MTFLEKMQAHKGELIKVNSGCRVIRDFMNGEVGMVCDATVESWWSTIKNPCIKVSLFIDGRALSVFLYESEVQFLKGPLPPHEKISPVDGQN